MSLVVFVAVGAGSGAGIWWAVRGFSKPDENHPQPESSKDAETTKPFLNKVAAESVAQQASHFPPTHAALIAEAPVSPAAATAVSRPDQPEPSNRPWLMLDVTPAKALVYKDGALEIGILFQYRNVGATPAQNVWFFPKMFTYKGTNGPSPIEERDRFCIETARSPLARSMGKTLFPGVSEGVNFTFGLSKSEVDAGLANFEGKILPIGIIGCAVYTVPGSSELHYTAVMLDIRKRSTVVSQGVSAAPFEDIPLSDLILYPSPIGGGVTSK